MKWKAAVEKNLQWFYSSGVMVPENGLWGAAKWGGGDLFEGGANSIYTGWTNAPIALTMLFEHTKKSMFGNP